MFQEPSSFGVPGIKPRTQDILGKHPSIEPQLQPRPMSPINTAAHLLSVSEGPTETEAQDRNKLSGQGLLSPYVNFGSKALS